MKIEEQDVQCRRIDTTDGQTHNHYRTITTPHTDSPLTPQSCHSQESVSPGAPKRKTKSGKEREKETRKRTRVTPEQLVQLEKYFSTDRSPTAGQRKEISDILGMEERQTQIWYQNRRAKAKMQGERIRSRGRPSIAKEKVAPVVEEPPSPPAQPVVSDTSNMVPENEAVVAIPCKDLTIGTWRRIATSPNQNDLVAYICDTKRCLTWFIHSDGYGFKMEIPFETIVDTQFTDNQSTASLATFIISQPPRFYLETASHSQPGGLIVRNWSQCADWTEGQQASSVLRHDLVGTSEQLTHLLGRLQKSASCRIFASSPAPTYRSLPSPVIPRVKIPLPPPMTSVPVMEPQSLNPGQMHANMQLASAQNNHFVPGHCMASGSSTSFIILPSLSYSPQSSFGMGSDFSTSPIALPSLSYSPESSFSYDSPVTSSSYDDAVEDYGTIIESLPPPPLKTFVAQAVAPSFYDDKSECLHPYDQEMYMLQQSGSFVGYNDCSSPALLATAYESPPQVCDAAGIVYHNPEHAMSISGFTHEPQYSLMDHS